ncbi:MAG: amino acid adenylation domain-containing protein, partial [Chloroflexota bacterium]
MDKENNRQEFLPLIPMQRGMLFHAITAPDSGVDVQHITMTLNEPININNFRSAWSGVAARHETLRASFDWENLDKPISYIAQEVSLPITKLDWRNLSKAQQEDQFQSLLEIDRQQGFNLKKPPLMRIMVIQISDSVTWCLWSFHHIILDGRSFPIVLQEVFTLYDALQDGKTVQLKDTFPFSDFVKISEAYDHAKSEKYWSELLDGFSAPTPLGLAYAKPSSPVASAVQNKVTFLSEHVTKKLNGFARDIGVTLNTLIQGAWGLLLHHYTAEKDIVFGNTRSGRNLYEPAKNSVGMFINTVPVRIKINNQQTLVDYLRELRAQHISVREHESSPLVQIQKWSDVDGSDSLFHTLVVFEGYDLSNVLRRNGGKWLKRKFNYRGQTSFPLTLMAYSDHQMRLRLEFDPANFKAATVEQILEHLKTLLQAMADRPYSAAVSIPYLVDAEKEFLVSKINPKVSNIGLEETIFETFSSIAAKNPSRVALIDENRSISYRELADRANQLAHHLRSIGATSNMPIGICMNRSVDMVMAMLAILGAGGAYVPLDPEFPRERLAHMIQDSNLDIIVTETDLESSLPHFEGRRVVLDKDRDDIYRQPITRPNTISRIDDLAYIIYTSGSTGKPKGVQVPHRAVTNFMLTMEAQPGITAEDTLLAVTTISFDISVLELFLPLMVGAKVVIASKDSAVDGRALNALMTEHNVSIMQATPATWRLLLDSGWGGKNDLKVLCGGERLSKDLASELIYRGDSLWNMYGPTETTIWSLVKHVSEDVIEAADVIPIGRPIANTTVFILNEKDELVPAGAPGELCIGGKGVTLGYINLDKQTGSKYFQTAFSKGLLYRTGDIAKYLPNGDVVCLGRRDNQLKVRGFRIEPGEVEGTILGHTSVKQTVVMSRPAQSGENTLVAYVVLDQDALLNVTELRKYASTRLPEYMVPTTWVILDSMPLTDNGKIDRQQLPEPDGSRPELENPYVAPKSETEKAIAEIWKGVLNIDRPGVHDNFFDLGGDSLLVVSALTKLRNQTGAKLSVADLYALRTIRTISEKIDKSKEAAETEAPPKAEANIEEFILPKEENIDLDAEEPEPAKLIQSEKNQNQTDSVDGFDFRMMGVEEELPDELEVAKNKGRTTDGEDQGDVTIESARQSIDELVSFDNWDWDDLDSEEDQVSVIVQKQDGGQGENTDLIRPNAEDFKTEYILDSPLSDSKASSKANEAFSIDFSEKSEPNSAVESEKADREAHESKNGELFEFDFDDVDFGDVEDQSLKKERTKDDEIPLLPETFSLNDVYLSEENEETEAEESLVVEDEESVLIIEDKEDVLDAAPIEEFPLDFEEDALIENGRDVEESDLFEFDLSLASLDDTNEVLELDSEFTQLDLSSELDTLKDDLVLVKDKLEENVAEIDEPVLEAQAVEPFPLDSDEHEDESTELEVEVLEAFDFELPDENIDSDDDAEPTEQAEEAVFNAAIESENNEDTNQITLDEEDNLSIVEDPVDIIETEPLEAFELNLVEEDIADGNVDEIVIKTESAEPIEEFSLDVIDEPQNNEVFDQAEFNLPNVKSDTDDLVNMTKAEPLESFELADEPDQTDGNDVIAEAQPTEPIEEFSLDFDDVFEQNLNFIEEESQFLPSSEIAEVIEAEPIESFELDLDEDDGQTFDEETNIETESAQPIEEFSLDFNEDENAHRPQHEDQDLPPAEPIMVLDLPDDPILEVAEDEPVNLLEEEIAVQSEVDVADPIEAFSLDFEETVEEAVPEQNLIEQEVKLLPSDETVEVIEAEPIETFELELDQDENQTLDEEDELSGSADAEMRQVEELESQLIVEELSDPIAELEETGVDTVETFDFDDIPVADLVTEDQVVDADSAANTWQEENADIAIIGMSGRFPGAKNLDEFWNNLVNGVEGLRHLTEDELRSVEIHYDEYKKDPDYVAATGLLDDVDMFDASFFGIKPVEARTLDPQQRLWFETAWETLESGGYDPKRFNGKIGVFAGSFMNSYVFYNLLPDRETIEDFVRLQAPESFMHMINNERDYMPTRTAYLFDLKGPAINVQTACSTSLVAVSLACRSILSGESDMALAGGVAIFLPQERGYFYQEGGMRSSDGHCRPFDAQASGTVFASGLGCVLLKKLDQALEDGDNILAVVKGTALNNDGTFKASYTAPSIAGQADVIRQAQLNAGIHPDSISYIEAHGTATPLGDPIEISGLSQAFAEIS